MMNNEERKNILVTGATGLIGSALVALFMDEGMLNVYAAGRNEERAKKRFSKYIGDSRFHFVKHDVRTPLQGDIQYHFIIHAASGADPRSFNNDPVGVMAANIDGVRNLLDYGRNHGMERLLYVSSGEVYGSDNIKAHNIDKTGSNGMEDANGDFCWKEEDSGYVDTMAARSSYPSSKRAAETLCAAYSAQYSLDVVVARPCHTYGYDFTETDNRAYAQFMRYVVNGEDIVMNSPGLQFRSWIYVKDCAEALRTILYKGVNGMAYNVADEQSCVTIREFAEIIAEEGGRKVITPDYTLITQHYNSSTLIMRATFDTTRLRSLGWQPQFTLRQGLSECLQSLRASSN